MINARVANVAIAASGQALASAPGSGFRTGPGPSHGPSTVLRRTEPRPSPWPLPVALRLGLGQWVLQYNVATQFTERLSALGTTSIPKRIFYEGISDIAAMSISSAMGLQPKACAMHQAEKIIRGGTHRELGFC